MENINTKRPVNLKASCHAFTIRPSLSDKSNVLLENYQELLPVVTGPSAPSDKCVIGNKNNPNLSICSVGDILTLVTVQQ